MAAPASAARAVITDVSMRTPDHQQDPPCRSRRRRNSLRSLTAWMSASLGQTIPGEQSRWNQVLNLSSISKPRRRSAFKFPTSCNSLSFLFFFCHPPFSRYKVEYLILNHRAKPNRQGKSLLSADLGGEL